MKKLLAMLVSILIIVALLSPVYAFSGGNSGGSDDDDSIHDSLDDYRKLLDDNKHDKAIRKELMKKIVYLRKKGGDDSIVVFVNDKEVSFDIHPVIVSNRTLIPVRAVTAALGAQVDWDPSQPDIVKVIKSVKMQKLHPGACISPRLIVIQQRALYQLFIVLQLWLQHSDKVFCSITGPETPVAEFEG